MRTFRVSLIIPVFNAGLFVQPAVESAVRLKDVCEIILIEDGSSDNSLTVCQELEKKFTNVKLFRHESGVNKGAGASRNLGLRNASFEYVAFLDADDVFLENRFTVTRSIFESHPDAVGVYEAIGAQFYDERGKESFCRIRNIDVSRADSYITRLKVTQPEDVYKYLITGKKGFFSTLGVTVKRDAFSEEFMFNEALRLHQDTELWIRLAYHFKFYEGSREPVALRGVHGENRISQQNLQSKYKYYSALMEYFRKKDIPFSIKMHLYKSLVRNHPDRRTVRSRAGISKFIELSKIGIRELPNLPLFW